MPSTPAARCASAPSPHLYHSANRPVIYLLLVIVARQNSIRRNKDLILSSEAVWEVIF